MSNIVVKQWYLFFNIVFIGATVFLLMLDKRLMGVSKSGLGSGFLYPSGIVIFSSSNDLPFHKLKPQPRIRACFACPSPYKMNITRMASRLGSGG